MYSSATADFGYVAPSSSSTVDTTVTVSSTTTNAVTVTADSKTDGTGIGISADALESGSALSVESSSTQVGSTVRSVAKIVQSRTQANHKTQTLSLLNLAGSSADPQAHQPAAGLAIESAMDADSVFVHYAASSDSSTDGGATITLARSKGTNPTSVAPTALDTSGFALGSLQFSGFTTASASN